LLADTGVRVRLTAPSPETPRQEGIPMADAGRITVLDPTSVPPADDADPGPDAGALAGRTVGIRVDRTWRSFDWVIDEWAPRLEAAGARTVVWVAGNRIGESGVRTAAELADFVERIDVAVVGLGN
jgi:hypothetical protein